ncbi:TonB-dependent receptor plug domain-containing protein [Nibricoccus sp. IMCC34717]|uniref:TonB-dependent receptor plug domain-containing protein n=1 Tax=Nibricoccus sp. IMCC34717 TaxID=3034021 RepID=UPI00384D5AFB
MTKTRLTGLPQGTFQPRPDLRRGDRVSSRASIIAAALCLAATSQAFAQTAPASTTPVPASTVTPVAAEDEVIELSPFVIEATEDAGYQAKATLAGTQVRTDLRDVGSAISVVTPKFLQDTNSKNAADLLTLTTNTEVAGQGGNFTGSGDGAIVDSSNSVNKPVANTRVRGLAEADNVRDFFLTDIPWDSYNVGRVDLQRGANSILFGIGSPAGIINSSINTASFKDANKVEAQVASFGTVRLTADFNKVLLKNELALRVALLRDDTKYRQKPAYRDDHRIFVAGAYSPKFLAVNGMKTTLRANFEKGNVHSNLPRLTPPMDAITPFFQMGNIQGFDNNGNPKTYNGFNKTTYRALEAANADNPGNVALFNPWVGAAGGRVYDGLLAYFNGPDASQQSGLAPSAARDFPASGQFGPPPVAYRGISTYANYLYNIRTPGWKISAFKNRSLTDPSIFDFYNNLIEGNNAKQWNKFKAYNLDLAQTFFNNKLGINVTYDKQETTFGFTNFISWDAGSIGVDIMDQNLDGTPNPNVGRAYLLGGGGSSGSYKWDSNRETIRAKVFGSLDAKDFFARDSVIASILGRHDFTLNYTDYRREFKGWGWNNWFIDQAYGPSAGSAVGQSSRDAISVTYLSGDIRGRANASDLHLSRITAMQIPNSATTKQWDKITGTWIDYQVPIARPGLMPEDTRWYNSQRLFKDKITSQVAVWQGHLLDDTLVPMLGWRKDIAKNWDAGSPDRYNPDTAKDAGKPRGIVRLNDQGFKIPSDDVDPTKNIYGAKFARAEGQTRTFSIVGKMPKVLKKKLPAGLDLSVFYNQSENFQPDAARIDIIGNPISAPTGKTKDYGVVISALDEKVTLKINRYKTSVSNATLSGAPIGNAYLIGAGEAWAQQAAVALKNDQGNWPGDGNYGTASNGKILRWQPEDIPANWVLNGQGQPVFTSSGAYIYNQAAIDRVYAEQVASVNDWLAKPIPASMQKAWGMTNYATGGGAWSMNNVVVTGDTESTGTEYELAANPMKGLEISFNAAKTDAKRLNIGKAYSDWIDKRWADFQGPMGDMRIWGGGNWFFAGKTDGTIRYKYNNEVIPNYKLMLATNNSNVAELRPWRFNITSNYSFQDGVLKGAFIGGSYRWMDKNVVGYKLNAAGDGYNVNDKWFGPRDTAIDLWLGYTRKVTDKINWRIQLNIRDLLASKKLIPVTVQPDGSPGTYRIPEPRVFTLINSFEF